MYNRMLSALSSLVRDYDKYSWADKDLSKLCSDLTEVLNKHGRER